MNKSLLFMFTTFLFVLSGCSGIGEPPLVTSTTSEESPIMQPKKIQVIILAGQSNMEGASWANYLKYHFSDEKVANYTQGFGLKIAFDSNRSSNHSDGEFVNVKIGQGTSANQFGPEIGMSEVLSEHQLNTDFVFIKYAVGGTSLANNWRSPSSGFTGDCYLAMVNFVNQQLQKLESLDYYPEVAGLCFMQGESDATNGMHHDYKGYLEKFIHDIRNEFSYYSNSNGIMFFDAGISNSLAWTNYLVINEAKQHVADLDDKNIYIDTIAAGLEYNKEPTYGPDIYHYDSDAEIELGHLFAYAIVDYISIN